MNIKRKEIVKSLPPLGILYSGHSLTCLLDSGQRRPWILLRQSKDVLSVLIALVTIGRPTSSYDTEGNKRAWTYCEPHFILLPGTFAPAAGQVHVRIQVQWGCPLSVLAPVHTWTLCMLRGHIIYLYVYHMTLTTNMNL